MKLGHLNNWKNVSKCGLCKNARIHICQNSLYVSDAEKNK